MNKELHPVNFVWQNLVTTEDQKVPSHTLIIFKYHTGRYTQYYLLPKEEAIARFTQQMNNRSPYEIESEGWDVEATELTFFNSEAWVGNISQQFQEFSQALLNQLTGED